MNTNKSAAWGFSVVEIVACICAVAAIVAISWLVYARQSKQSAQQPKTTATQVIITREDPLHHSGISTFTKTVSGSAATALLNDIQSLKPVPGDANAVYNCPSDDGITYTFAFRNPGLSATAAASSCEWVTMSGKTYLSTDKFWHDVTKATGQSI